MDVGRACDSRRWAAAHGVLLGVGLRPVPGGRPHRTRRIAGSFTRARCDMCARTRSTPCPSSGDHSHGGETGTTEGQETVKPRNCSLLGMAVNKAKSCAIIAAQLPESSCCSSSRQSSAPSVTQKSRVQIPCCRSPEVSTARRRRKPVLMGRYRIGETAQRSLVSRARRACFPRQPESPPPETP